MSPPLPSLPSLALTLGCLLSFWLLLCAPAPVRLSGVANNGSPAGGDANTDTNDALPEIFEEAENDLNVAHQLLEYDQKLGEREIGAPVSGSGASMQSSQSLREDQGFLAKVRSKLNPVGQMLSTLVAPKISATIKSLPAKLRKLIKWPDFLSFKLMYNKVYKSFREELYRKMVYLHTQATVWFKNLKFLFGKATSILRATEFADLTAKEYREIFHNKLAETPQNSVGIHLLDPQTKQRLEELSKQRRNIFGQDMSAIIESSKGASESRSQAADPSEATRERIAQRSTERNAEVETWMQPEPKKEKKAAKQQKKQAKKPQPEDEEDDDSAIWFFGRNKPDLLEIIDAEDFEGFEETIDDYAALFDYHAGRSNAAERRRIVEDAISHDTLIESSNYEPFDLRKTKCIEKPAYQASCGNCYAHSVIASAFYYNCMASGGDPKSMVHYSARFVSDCGKYLTPYLRGCAGGRVSKSIFFTGKAGAFDSKVYDAARKAKNLISPTQDECAYPKPDDVVGWGPFKVKRFESSYYDEIRISEMDLHLRTVGPVYANLNIWAGFNLYGGGIFDEIQSKDRPDHFHTMMIVGHNRDHRGRLYWIVWNTHGVLWGEKGYLRIYNEALKHYLVHAGGFVPREHFMRTKEIEQKQEDFDKARALASATRAPK